MSRLILMRHGKAETAGATGGDAERPLAARGHAESARTAGWLAAAGLGPDRALVSSALRTWQTWEIVAAAFPAATAERRNRLYLAGPETLLEAVSAAGEAPGALMIVGHNPGLQELALRLAIEAQAPPAQVDRISHGLPTAAAWVFRIDAAGRGARLEAVYEPPRAASDPPRWAFPAPASGEQP